MAFEARSSRRRIALALIGIAMFVAAGGWLAGLYGSQLVGAFGAPQRPADDAWIVGWITMIAFGGVGLLGVQRLFQSGIEIRIDQQGIWWRRGSRQTIPWSDIDRITVRETKGQRLLCLVLRDPTAYPSGVIWQALQDRNKAQGFGDITFNAMGTDKSFSDLIAAIEQFAPAGLLA